MKPLLAPPKTNAPLGLSFVTPVRDRSRYSAVAWAGCWLKREFGYDWSLFQPEVWKDTGWREAFIYVVHTGNSTRVVGAGGCHCPEYSNMPTDMRELMFAWFHPHYRRCGYLTSIWAQLTARWGPFIVQEPISPAMKHFLSNKPSESIRTTDAQAFAVATYGSRDVT